MGKKSNEDNIDLNNIEEVNALINRIVNGIVANSVDKKGNQQNPLFYGFSIKVDNNGISLVENDSKTAQIQNNRTNEKREPLVDMIERPEYTVIMAEVPGVDKENIKLDLQDGKLSITAHGKERQYNKSVNITSSIDILNSSARYNNGVLEINLKKGTYNGKETSIKLI